MNDISALAASSNSLSAYPCLEPHQCQQICQQLDELRQHWLRRDPDHPYFTLGAASYLDAADGPDHYARLALQHNPLLARHFHGLYQRLRDTLIAHTGEDFQQAPEAALPGFHIFEFDPLFRTPIASVHVDRQHRDIPWQDPAAMDHSTPLSFTLPLCLPASGGGLNVWEAHGAVSEWCIPHLLTRKQKPCYQPYTTGVLMLHSGNLLHQIAPVPGMQPGDRRITLQGHALKRAGVYQIYW